MFKRVREKPGFRQAYLDSVDLGHYRRYVGLVKYVSSDTPYGYTMFTVPHPLSKLCVKGLKSKINVYSSAFEHPTISSEEIFLSWLDHELCHAKDNFDGNGLNLSDIFYLNGPIAKLAEMERRAFEYQLEMIEKGARNVSPEFADKIRRIAKESANT